MSADDDRLASIEQRALWHGHHSYLTIDLPVDDMRFLLGRLREVEATAAEMTRQMTEQIGFYRERMRKAEAALARVEALVDDYDEYATDPSIPAGHWAILRATGVVDAIRAAIKGGGDHA